MLERRSFRAVAGRIGTALGIALLVVGLAGCGKETQTTGQAVAKAGVATANNLADYYASLSQDSQDTWEMEAFGIALPGVPPSGDNTTIQQTIGERYKKRIAALDARARMAHGLAQAYDALLRLSSANVSADVEAAGKNLGDELNKLPQLEKGPLPSTIIGSVAGDLMQLKQSQDIRKEGRRLLNLLTALDKLFVREMEAYKAVEGDRGEQIKALTKDLIKKKHIVAGPLITKVPEALGLSLADPGKAENDEALQDAFIQVANIRVERLARASAGAADSTHQSLLVLLDTHKKLVDHQPVSLASVAAVIQRAQTYLDEVAAFRAEQKKAKEKEKEKEKEANHESA
jgi:hypothetical protein